MLIKSCMFLTVLLICYSEIVSANRWEYFNATDSSYYIKSGLPNMTFSEAEEHCISIGGHLTSIHSHEENIYVSNLANKYIISPVQSLYTDMLLIGLTRIAPNSSIWNYTDGSQVDYTNWTPILAPNNRWNAEDCVIIMGLKSVFKGYDYYQWNDYVCDDQYHTHICKKPGQMMNVDILKIQELKNKLDCAKQQNSQPSLFSVVIIISILLVIVSPLFLFVGYRLAGIKLSKCTNIHVEQHKMPRSYNDGDFPIREPSLDIHERSCFPS